MATAKKKNTVAYINRQVFAKVTSCKLTNPVLNESLTFRNCGALNGRNQIVKELMDQYSVTAYGCLGKPDRVDKDKVFSESKFCIAMENSNAPHYVSEKVRALWIMCRPCN